MPKQRVLLTNWSKGQLTPLLDSRSDLAGYYEGASVLSNFLVLRQGGVRRRSGTRFVKATKIAANDTVLIPFEFSVTQAYMLEFGHLYIRVYKNKAPVLTSAGGPQVEIVSPYTKDDLRAIHFTQSADVLFLFHPSYQQRTLSRSSDTNWALALYKPTPPPSFETTTDISLGTKTLTPAATTGLGVLFTASAALFLTADVGRNILSGTSRAVIVGLGTSAGDTTSPNTHVRADILTDFPSTAAIPPGQWFLDSSPKTTLDPTLQGPVGAVVQVTAGANAFRTADVGKFIKVYGGMIELVTYSSPTVFFGYIRSLLSESTLADPPVTVSGAWTLEFPSWSAAAGWPRTGEFFQGRLWQASTASQPTTIWGSASDDYYNYALGVGAADAVEYTIASRQVNQIQWIADNIALMIGTAGSEHRAYGSGNANALIGGDNIPLVERITTHGCAPIQPLVSNRQVVFVDRSRKKVYAIGYDITQDGFDAKELTVFSEDVMNAGVSLGPIAYAKRPDPRLYFVTDGGALVSMTYFLEQKIIAFSVFITPGSFESVAVIPDATDTEPDQVWVTVNRFVNGNVVRYVEVIEENDPNLFGRPWTSYQTDAAMIIKGTAPAMTFTAAHLAGMDVQIVTDGVYRGTFTLDANGSVNLDPPATVVEMGLAYASNLQSMRPALLNGPSIDGLPRSWDSVFVRLFNSYGGTLQFEPIQYDPLPGGAVQLVTAEHKVNVEPGADTNAWLELGQDQPYPMVVTGLFGTLNIGDYD